MDNTPGQTSEQVWLIKRTEIDNTRLIPEKSCLFLQVIIPFISGYLRCQVRIDQSNMKRRKRNDTNKTGRELATKPLHYIWGAGPDAAGLWSCQCSADRSGGSEESAAPTCPLALAGRPSADQNHGPLMGVAAKPPFTISRAAI
jgi:hypothetical protein